MQPPLHQQVVYLPSPQTHSSVHQVIHAAHPGYQASSPAYYIVTGSVHGSAPTGLPSGIMVNPQPFIPGPRMVRTPPQGPVCYNFPGMHVGAPTHHLATTVPRHHPTQRANPHHTANTVHTPAKGLKREASSGGNEESVDTDEEGAVEILSSMKRQRT